MDFKAQRVFNSLFSVVGVSDSYRGLIWIKLLQAEQLRDGAEPGMYLKLAEMSNVTIDAHIKKDQVERRTILFSHMRKNDKTWQVPGAKLKRLIKAYATIDEEAGSCAIGWNFIIALLCRFISPDDNEEDLEREEMVFYCLLRIMHTMNWRQYCIQDS